MQSTSEIGFVTTLTLISIIIKIIIGIHNCWSLAVASSSTFPPKMEKSLTGRQHRINGPRYHKQCKYTYFCITGWEAGFTYLSFLLIISWVFYNHYFFCISLNENFILLFCLGWIDLIYSYLRLSLSMIIYELSILHSFSIFSIFHPTELTSGQVSSWKTFDLFDFSLIVVSVWLFFGVLYIISSICLVDKTIIIIHGRLLTTK